MPTFNSEELLEKSIESVISQTYKCFELLIIDNNSTDNTSQIISKYKDSRITYIKISNKGIIAKSRNLGIEISRGNWIAFLDSDDIWFPKRLEKICQLITKKKDLDVITTNEYKVFKNSKRREKLFYGISSKNKYKSLLLYGNRLSPSATVVRKKFLKINSISFCEKKEFVTVEDYDLWLTIANKNAKFYFLKTFQGEYLIHEKNTSAKISTHNLNLKNLLKYHVYQVQNFDKNKEELFFKLMNSREFIFSIKKRNFKEAFFIMNKSPNFIFRFLLLKTFNKIKDELFFFK